MFDENNRDWGLALMLSHGLGGACMGAEIGMMVWATLYGKDAHDKLICPAVDALTYIGWGVITGTISGFSLSKLIYGSSPFFFWSRPKGSPGNSHTMPDDTLCRPIV